MKKGCTGIQNLQLLRWGKEMGFHIAWNLLFGFPGEPIDAYDKAAQLMPKLHHLQPPVCAVRIRMDRYSPNFVEPEAFGFREVRASKYYAHLFPASADNLHLMAHFFDYEYADGRDPFAYTAQFRRACDEWQAASKSRPVLDASDDGNEITIRDTRTCAVRRRHRLTGLSAHIFRVLDAGRDPEALSRMIAPASDEEFSDALEDLLNKNLIAEWEGKYIALAVFRKRPAKEIERRGTVVETASTPKHAIAQ